MKTRTPSGPKLSPQQLLTAAIELAEQGKLEAGERADLERAKKNPQAAQQTLSAIVARYSDGYVDGSSDPQGQALSQTGAKVLPFARRSASPQTPGARHLSPQTSTGPAGTLTERTVLEDLLSRHGATLDGQLHNLVKGFLRSLDDEVSAPAPQYKGQLAQIVAIAGEHKAYTRHLDVDAEKDPLPRTQIEALLDANAARGQLLVALGAASPEELAQLDAGQMTLGQFYRLAARGHFGDATDQPLAYDDLRQRLSSAGLEMELHHLGAQLDNDELEPLLDGQLSPRQIFTLLARQRTRSPEG